MVPFELPPGPPVLATLLAEIYGPDPETRRAVAGNWPRLRGGPRSCASARSC